ncbi:MAG TPA: MdtA/MuxA family multidrug efflux RND transporter periplasmic adaptor subunit [Bryobacteraceae bacterium]
MEKQGSGPAEEAPASTPPKPKEGALTGAAPKRKWRWRWLVVLALLGVAVYLFRPQFGQLRNRLTQPPTAQAGSPGRGSGRKGGPSVLPVVATRATRGNIGVYYTGLGAVTPIYTVTIKSRVDGQLMKVHFKEGDVVHQGNLLVEIDPRPYQAALEQAEGTLIRDQALLANARLDLDRYATLVKQNAAPEQQYATQKALVSQYEGTVKTDQGNIDAAKVNVAYCSITAPITGLVGLRLVDPGNIVHSSDANGMLVITQMQPMSVIFTISEDQLPGVLQKYRAGQTLTVDAYDREMKARIAEGKLAHIDNQIDQSTGTLKLRAEFDNSKNELFPNQFVNVKLLVQEKRGVTLLNTAAVQRNAQNTYVYVVKPDSTVTIRQIETGVTEGDQTEITSGLMPGDEVVMTGVDKLQEGTPVNAVVPGEQPSAAKAGKKGKRGEAGK